MRFLPSSLLALVGVALAQKEFSVLHADDKQLMIRGKPLHLSNMRFEKRQRSHANAAQQILSMTRLPDDEAVCRPELSACSITLIDGSAASVCLDLQTDVEACGACNTTCISIPHAMKVSCVKGQCQVESCKYGFEPSLDSTLCIMKEVTRPAPLALRVQKNGKKRL